VNASPDGAKRTPISARVRRWLWAPLLAVSLFFFAWGVHTGGFAEVQAWFGQLCTACIGLTAR
jgi:hypothetical protein